MIAEAGDGKASETPRPASAVGRFRFDPRGVALVDQAFALDTVDAVSADRLRAVDAELSGTISPTRRQALIEERAAITESLGPGGLDKAQSDLRIGPNRRLRDALKALGYAVDWHTYPMPHSVHPQEVADIGTFLRKVLAAKSPA